MQKTFIYLPIFFLILSVCNAQSSSEKKEGLVKKYYENGKLQGEAYFHNNKLNGISRVYDREGNLESETVYEDGFEVGARLRDKSGNLIKDTSLERTIEYPDWLLESIEVETFISESKNLLVNEKKIHSVGTLTLNKSSESFLLSGHRETYRKDKTEREYLKIESLEKGYGDSYKIKLRQSSKSFTGHSIPYDGYIKKTKIGFSINLTGYGTYEQKSTHHYKVYLRNLTNEGRDWKKVNGY